ncbi:MAG: HEAT repeat domain-containing protein [Deltaproteobacteria bacterium]|nr:HEAT repeat domain-containing protein [Deltaproteobacteria bacterium]
MRFYCPRCWRDFAKDVTICPHCGLDIREFWKSRDYVEKLIIALEHPEKETPIRAAWLLGQLKDSRAVLPLIELVKKTEDVYIARAAVQALGEIDTPEARQFLGTLVQHQAKMVRDEVDRILAKNENTPKHLKKRRGL